MRIRLFIFSQHGIKAIKEFKKTRVRVSPCGQFQQPIQRQCDAGASTTNIGNSIFIMENSDSGGFETLKTPNIFLYPSILSLVTILIWSCFIIERFVLQIQVVSLFNLESLFSKSK